MQLNQEVIWLYLVDLRNLHLIYKILLGEIVINFVVYFVGFALFTIYCPFLGIIVILIQCQVYQDELQIFLMDPI